MRRKARSGSSPIMRLPRMFITAKTWIAILMLCSVNLNAAIFAQTKIDIKKKDASGEEIFRYIRQVSNYTFVYDSEAIGKIPPATLELKDATIDDIMRVYLKNTDFTYTIDNNTVIIRSRGNIRAGTVQQQPKQIIITGTVTDTKKVTLPGVTVRVKGTSLATATDKNGHYSISIPGDVKDPVLVFSLVGMKAQEIRYSGKNVINAVLSDDVQNLGEIVITGIFNKPKDSYTGAERTITREDLDKFQGRNIFVTLSNIDPSFYIVPDNNLGSDPNHLPEIQLRGTRNLPNIEELRDQTSAAINSPLIILDGFPSSLQRLMDLDKNQIESITLLKDGSATALYGSRGSNGVIVITTKEPKAGKLRLTYRGQTNVSVPALGSYHLLNARDKLELERLSGYYADPTVDASGNISLQQYYNQKLNAVESGLNTDWLSKPLRTDIDQDHFLQLEGGDQAFRYSLGVQYNNINGVMKGSNRQTINGTVDLAYHLKKLNFRNSLMLGHMKADQSPYGSFADYARLNPYWSPYDSDGKVVRYFPYNWYFWADAATSLPNPLYDATLNTYNTGTYTSIINNFQVDWNPVRNLLVRGGVGINTNMNYNDDFKPAEHSAFAGYNDADLLRRGSYNYISGKDFSYSANLSANYSNLFAGVHRLYGGINVDVNEARTKSYSFKAEGFPDETIDFIGMALQYEQDGSPGGAEATTRRIGVVGNVNYAYRDRYLADFAYRLDGASQFGTDKRFAPFWSAGIGWNLHNEPFIKESLPFVDRLKIRGSYGVTGNQQFAAYQSLPTYTYITDDHYKNWLGAVQTALGNPDLQWQKTGKYDIGIETELFRSVIMLQADVYREYTSNLLSSLELPYSNGFTSYVENIGKLQQQGWELSATVRVLRKERRRIYWSLTGNIQHNEDKIVKLSEAMKAANDILLNKTEGNTPNKIIREGVSQNTIYAVRSLGIDPSTGKELYLNKDGEVTYSWASTDRVPVGLSQPKYTGNFSTLFRYGNTSLSASFGFRFGGQIYNQTLIDKIENANRFFNVDERVFYDRWKQPGDKAAFRGINETSIVYPSSRFVQNESTLTCQNINLSYDLTSKRLLHRLGLQSLSVTANTGELFYLSTVRQERGLDYPFTRQFSLSLFAIF